MNVNFGRSTSQARFSSSASSREFLIELSNFHERRRTAFSTVPMLHGRAIDLHKLYLTVCSLGGCRKVTEKNRWQKVCTESGFLRAATAVDAKSYGFGELTAAACSNAAYACKLIYMRWLEPFERVHLFGQPDDPLGSATTVSYFDDAFEPTRTRRLAAVTATASLNVSGLLDVPATPVATASGFQRVVDASTRRENGLSSDIRTSNEYDRVVLALLSGLPNEVDLAFNALVLLATDDESARHTHPHAHGELDLRRAPILVDLMLAHVGFYSADADSLFTLDNAWRHATRRNYFRFWWHATAPAACRSARRFLFPRCFSHDAETTTSYCETDVIDDESGVLSEAEHVVFGSAEASRVYQAAFVLHAASAEAQRGDLLLSRDTLLRFLLVSASCTHLAPLRRLALDTLVNLCASSRAMHAFLKDNAKSTAAPDVKRRALLAIVCSLLDSADRHDTLVGLELLAAIAHSLHHRPPANAPTPASAPAPDAPPPAQKHDAHNVRTACFMRLAVSHIDVVAPCYRLLLVADAAVIVGALEALLALATTKLRTFADHVASQWPQLLALLVAFLSLDARALGRPALRGVRVFHESVAVASRHSRRERERERERERARVALPTQHQVVLAERAPPSRPIAIQPHTPVTNIRPPDCSPAPINDKKPDPVVPTPTPTHAAPIQHGRAAALQWLLLRCEMNDVAPNVKPSRSCLADVTSEADLYADYLRYVSNPTRPPPTCSACGAAAANCTCSSVQPPQPLNVSDLKLIVRQVYPQIREAPGGGFIGLKLKSYLHSSVKARPLPTPVAPPTPLAAPANSTVPAAVADRVAVNGFVDKAPINGPACDARTLGYKRSLSPPVPEQPHAKVARGPEIVRNGTRNPIANAEASDDDDDEDEDDEVDRREREPMPNSTPLEPPPKRKRGRPRKNLPNGTYSSRSSLRRPETRTAAKRIEPERKALPPATKSDLPDWTPNGPAVPSVPLPCIPNGDDEPVPKSGVLRAEPPSVFAPAPARRGGERQPANGDDVTDINSTATQCGVTHEVIIERVKSKLERQRNEREYAAASSRSADVDSEPSPPVVNGYPELVVPLRENGLVVESVPAPAPVYVSADNILVASVGAADNSLAVSTGTVDNTLAAPTEALADLAAAPKLSKYDTHPTQLNGFHTTHKAVLPAAEQSHNHVDTTQTNGDGEARSLPSPADPMAPAPPQPTPQLPPPSTLRYTCKWLAPERCTVAFGSLRELLAHAYAAHCDVRASSCCWSDCSETSLQRSGYSLFMHLEERHCREADFAAPAAAAAGVGAPPRTTVAYPVNAALQAVRKLAPRPPFRELVDAPEGVLTRHIRLTSALTLHALCDVSPLARDALKHHVPTLAQLAFSERDAASTVARILQRLSKHELAMSAAPACV